MGDAHNNQIILASLRLGAISRIVPSTRNLTDNLALHYLTKGHGFLFSKRLGVLVREQVLAEGPMNAIHRQLTVMKRGMDMKRVTIRHFIMALIFMCLFIAGLSMAASPLKKGGTLPEITLPVPKDPAQKDYLGLSQDTTFQIPQIKAQVVIIEIFNMY